MISEAVTRRWRDDKRGLTADGGPSMSTTFIYALPVELTEWRFDGRTETCFTWEYDDARAALIALYDKGKRQQWNAADRIDWSLDLDYENPMGIDDGAVPIYGSDIWNRLTDKEKVQVRRHSQAFTLSQFMHGEQGALIATAKIVQAVPTLDAKFYAATQTIDEARHVEAYKRLLQEKLGLAYPINSALKALLENGLGGHGRLHQHPHLPAAEGKNLPIACLLFQA